RSGIGVRGRLGLLLEELADPLRGAERALDLAVKLGERTHGPADKHGVEHEAGQLACCQAASLHEAGAIPKYQHDAAKQGEGDKGSERSAVARPAQYGLHKSVQAIPVAVDLKALVGE